MVQPRNPPFGASLVRRSEGSWDLERTRSRHFGRTRNLSDILTPPGLHYMRIGSTVLCGKQRGLHNKALLLSA